MVRNNEPASRAVAGRGYTLRMRPPEELEILRYNPRKIGNFTIKADSEMNMKDIHW